MYGYNGRKCTDMCRLPDCDSQAASILDDKESSDVQGDKIEDEPNDDDDYEFRLRLKHNLFTIIVTLLLSWYFHFHT